MEFEQKVKLLKKEFKYWDSTARVYVDFKGHCIYCGVNLIGDARSYALGVIDHLLPKDKYKELKNEQKNWLLSCSGCNTIKGNYDCLAPGEDPKNMLLNHREELIQRVKDWFNHEFEIKEPIRKRVAEIINY